MGVMYATVYYSTQNSSRYLYPTESGNSGYNAALRVDDGTVLANGYRGQAGVNGTASNTFNIQWDNPRAYVWIDETRIGVIATLSDYRMKRNVTAIPDGALDRINTLRPVQFKWKDYVKDASAGLQTRVSTATDEINEGFIAHELQEIIPSAVDGEKDDPVTMQNIKNDAISAVVVKALQELSEKVNLLESKVEDQKNDINNLKQQITELQSS